MKILLAFCGATASGKTTTRASLCGAPILIERRKHGKYPVCTTLYKEYGLAGNVGTGSDANIGPDIIMTAMRHCLIDRDIVIFDGVMSSPRFSELAEDFDHIIVIYFNLSLEENQRRLVQRRTKNGLAEPGLSDKTQNNLLNFRRRAETAASRFQSYSTPSTLITVSDTCQTEDIVAQIKEKIQLCPSTQTT